MDAEAEKRLGKRKAQKAQTRTKVSAVARTLFIEHGYENTTMRGLAKACGVTPGAIFPSFDDKDDLFVQVITGESDARIQALRKIADDRELEQARGPFRHILEILGADYDALRVQLPLLKSVMSLYWIKPGVREVVDSERQDISAIISGIVYRMPAKNGGELDQAHAFDIVSDVYDLYLAGYRRLVFDEKSNTVALTSHLERQLRSLLEDLVDLSHKG